VRAVQLEGGAVASVAVELGLIAPIEALLRLGGRVGGRLRRVAGAAVVVGVHVGVVTRFLATKQRGMANMELVLLLGTELVEEAFALVEDTIGGCRWDGVV
jgi:hypothetical protein